MAGRVVRGIGRRRSGEAKICAATVFGFTFGLEHPLNRWEIIGWGLAMVVHGLCVYEVINLFGPDRERRLVEKRLGRKL